MADNLKFDLTITPKYQCLTKDDCIEAYCIEFRHAKK